MNLLIWLLVGVKKQLIKNFFRLYISFAFYILIYQFLARWCWEFGLSPRTLIVSERATWSKPNNDLQFGEGGERGKGYSVVPVHKKLHLCAAAKPCFVWPQDFLFVIGWGKNRGLRFFFLSLEFFNERRNFL